jgi:hypothetical protein
VAQISWFVVVPVFAAQILVAGCSRAPARPKVPRPDIACLDHDNLNTVAAMIYEATERSIDSSGADGSVKRPAALLSRLAELRAQKPLQFDTETFDGFDPTTKAITCSATIHYALQPSDRTQSSKHIMRNVSGLSAPGDLFGVDPQTVVTFKVQPAPGGDGSVVTLDDAQGPSEALLMVLIVRQIRLTGRSP